MSKKIAIVLPELRVGGAERVMIQLANYWTDTQSADVDLLLIRKSGALVAEVSPNVNIIDLSNTNRWFALSATIAFFGLVKYMCLNRSTAYLATLTGTNIFSIMAALFSGSRKRLTIREACSTLNIKSKLKVGLANTLYKYAYRVIAVSSDVHSDLVNNFELNKSRISVINNPIHVDGIREKSKILPGERVGSRETGKSLVALGRLNYQKGLDLLLRALQELHCDFDWHLTIVGSGPEKATLQALAFELKISNRISFVAQLNNPYQHLLSAQLVVLPSRWEGFPNVLLEGMALGKVIVCSDCDGIKTFLAKSKLPRGIFVSEVNNVSSLRISILKALQHPSDVVDYGSILKSFELPVIAKKYLECVFSG